MSSPTGFDIDNQNIAKVRNRILNQQNECIIRLAEAIQNLTRAIANDTDFKMKKGRVNK